MALTKSVRPITADVTSYQDIDGLLAGIAWTSLNLTYSFPDSTTDYSKYYGNGEPSSSFKALNTVQQNAVTTILTEYASISNLSFTLIPFHSSTDATATLRSRSRISRAQLGATILRRPPREVTCGSTTRATSMTIP